MPGHTPESIDALVDSLTLVEQVSLLAGSDFWHTVPIERVGIPAMRVSDGPAGSRGTEFDGPASVNIPCSTSLAAAWDPDLVEEVGRLLGRETRLKGARVLLAPTVNLHRTPVGGRNFECMSEDPYLTARIAVAYVRGLQAEGVASCIKHFVGNDTEFERNSIDSQIDERTLRELYLVPFEAAVREAGVQAIMTGYNRINGPFCADSTELVTGVLRDEWGFAGLVISDWFGLHSTVEGVIAGLDLEMPGPTRHRGEALVAAVERGEIDAALIRSTAHRLLTFMNLVGAFDDGTPGTDQASPGHPADRALVRRAGAAGMVLLRNELRNGDAALPFTRTGVRRVAIIGPNSAHGEIMGGGSAHVTPTHTVGVLAALTERFSAAGIEVRHEQGCSIQKRLPALDMAICTPLDVQYFDDPSSVDDPDATPARRSSISNSRLMWFTDPIDKARQPRFGVVATSTVTPDVSGPWTVSVTSVADARLYVDGELMIDNSAAPKGGSFFGMGKAESTATIEMTAGHPVEIEVRLVRESSNDALTGLHIGAARPADSSAMQRAIDAAVDCDLTVLIVGTNDEWESEGWDRDELSLPGEQDELIRRVSAVSVRTVVVVNAGSPVSMPWLDMVDAVLMAWFPGQEMGDSLADVLFGAGADGPCEPSGRLPVTFPHSLEDTPAFEHHPGRNGEAKYLERRLIGYRWYDTVGREPLFAFGHGLGYASLTIESATLIDPFAVEVAVMNPSERDGNEVVQVYASRRVAAGEREVDEPVQRLVGFARVAVPAGDRRRVRLDLDPRTYSGWDVATHAWAPIDGAWELRVGRSSRAIVHTLEVASPR